MHSDTDGSGQRSLCIFQTMSAIHPYVTVFPYGISHITEKSLEGLPDVFADIINVLLFNGRRVINPNNLSDSTVRSIYKAEGQIFEQERDVAKSWKILGIPEK